MNRRISLPAPDDFHAHLRRGPAMPAYARSHESCFGRALVMPNTVPPVASAAEVEAYRAEIAAAAPGLRTLMCFKLIPGMGPELVRECARVGAVAGKYYPAGSTTQSADGVRDPAEILEELRAMEEAGLVLSVHAEDPLAPVLEREAAFLPVLDRIVSGFPSLKVVMEHVSSEAGLDFVLRGPERLGATVTAHHLLFTIDDVMGGAMNPHLHCKPAIKSARDRDALRDAVFRGERKLFFGSDSAPHPRSAKERGAAASGVYSSPTALCALAGLFEDEGRLEALEGFVAGRGAAFYGLGPPSGGIELEASPWIVPEEADGAVPMLAGSEMRWRIAAGR